MPEKSATAANPATNIFHLQIGKYNGPPFKLKNRQFSFAIQCFVVARFIAFATNSQIFVKDVCCSHLF